MTLVATAMILLSVVACLLGHRDGGQPDRSHQREGGQPRHRGAGHDGPDRRPDPAPAPLAWSPCQGELECATLTVPIDYDDPSVGTIGLAVVRRPAALTPIVGWRR